MNLLGRMKPESSIEDGSDKLVEYTNNLIVEI